MPGMSLKLVLAWLCFVMVWFGVVLGSSDSSTSLDKMELSPNTELSTETACLLGESNPCVEMDNLHLSGLDNFNSEMSEHQIHIMKERITACLEWMGIIVHPLVGNRLIESRNPDGSIGWIFEMNSIEDRMRVVEDMQANELIDYLDELKGIPGVRKVATIYRRQALKIETNSFHILPTPNSTFKPTSTNPNEESITYQQCLEDLQPLKKITSPNPIRIVGGPAKKVILDQLELLLFLLRIADSPTIEIDWLDVYMSSFDAKSIDRFKPLLKDIPAKLKKSELVINIISACDHVLWGAFLKLVGEKYDIKMTFMEGYPTVSLNANST
ncbi:hypothetical protein NEHOM01_1695 [Nematocida homosporus]|uniref:uncharacterized protein n=1 Tax=Nematocida homosporus TaxID=1912981 RepID=UPI0022208E02|nr:uncharacterized protein NEHOM01_1695 [Nematocida homosporus]KAI5186775.1 hypothetical protein NEHOM01_1695 [Nematocida homosporus]